MRAVDLRVNVRRVKQLDSGTIAVNGTKKCRITTDGEAMSEERQSAVGRLW